MNCVAIYLTMLFAQLNASPHTTADAPVHFDTDIIPLLTKSGCNSGACHGAAAGRGGFHLSLLGANPDADYDSILHDFEGRRINFVAPKQSLIFAKPTGNLDHGGEVLFDEDSPLAVRMLNWIRAGAPRNRMQQLTSLHVEPADARCEQLPATVPVKVVAEFENGPARDVTAWALITATDPGAIKFDDQHRAHVLRSGQHVIIVRYLNCVVPLQVNAPFGDSPADHSHIDYSQQPSTGLIDDQVLNLLSELRLPISPPAPESAWLRRVTLDLTGRLPEPNHAKDYLHDTTPDKRAKEVDALLASDAFADYWTLRFGKLLRMHSLPNETTALHAYKDWLRREIADGTPFDEIARQLLVATGDSHLVGPANFARMVPDARAQAELVGNFFLGVRLGCANCHNHPLDRWTQDDYHGLASVFAPLDRSRHVAFTTRGAVTNLRTGEPAVPRIPNLRDLKEPGDHRSEIVDWITSKEHLYFARATVNRLWKAMFGRGLVDPTDDLRETNPATHPQLLTLLAEDFAKHGYNIRRTLKQISLSHAYSRSSECVTESGVSNELDDRFYARAYRRSLEPEVLLDAIADVTGVPVELPDQTATRAVLIVDPLTPAPALDVLGRCKLASGCDDSQRDGVGLPAQLHLMNGDLINRRLRSDSGRLRQLIAAGISNEAIITEFYMRALSRPANSVELQRWQIRLESDDPADRLSKLEDFVWSLLNSRLFQENH